MSLKRKERKLSLEPQYVNENIWYYENRGSIEVFIDRATVRAAANDQTCFTFRIPKRKLVHSLERMRCR